MRLSFHQRHSFPAGDHGHRFRHTQGARLDAISTLAHSPFCACELQNSGTVCGGQPTPQRSLDSVGPIFAMMLACWLPVIKGTLPARIWRGEEGSSIILLFLTTRVEGGCLIP